MRWLRVAAHFTEALEDASLPHEALASMGCSGTEESPDGLTVAGYLPDTLGAWERVAEVGGQLLALGAREVEVRAIEEQDWANSWRQFFVRRQVGERVVVVPAWEEHEPSEGEIAIVLEPGQAFGTGEHATTQLCLELLERFVSTGDRVLDVGTGSGVLAILCARLGATVWATEREEAAVHSAKENFERNGVSVRLFHTELLPRPPEGEEFDIVVANLVSAAHMRMAAEVARSLRAGGRWLISGVIPDNWSAVLAAAEEAGFELQERVERGGWIAAVFSLGGDASDESDASDRSDGSDRPDQPE